MAARRSQPTEAPRKPRRSPRIAPRSCSSPLKAADRRSNTPQPQKSASGAARMEQEVQSSPIRYRCHSVPQQHPTIAGMSIEAHRSSKPPAMCISTDSQPHTARQQQETEESTAALKKCWQQPTNAEERREKKVIAARR